MDVARGDARDPQALRQAGEPAVARHVAPPQRALELDAKAVAAEGAHQALAQRHRRGGLGAGRACRRRARRSRRARRRERSRRGRRALRCARSRDESGSKGGRASRREAPRAAPLRSPSVHAMAPDSVRVRSLARRLAASVGVRFREEQAEVPPARGRLDQEREVEGRSVRRVDPVPGTVPGTGGATVSSAPTIGRTPSGWQAEANSIAPQTPSWSVIASASWPCAAAAAASSSGEEAPSRNEKPEWQWSSTYPR